MASGRFRFHPLGVKLDPYPSVLRYVYVKRHDGSDGVAADCAIFVVGLPVRLGKKEHLEELFGVFGGVEECVLHPSKMSALIVFENKETRENALKAASTGHTIEYMVPNPCTGLKGWLSEHKSKRPGNEALQEQIDDWMMDFEKKEEEMKKAQSEAMQEDGWVVVEAKGKRHTLGDSGVGAAGITARAANKKAKSSKIQVFQDLYRFQRKEKKAEEVLSLRQRFAEDKKRLAEMRANRRFKPY